MEAMPTARIGEFNQQIKDVFNSNKQAFDGNHRYLFHCNNLFFRYCDSFSTPIRRKSNLKVCSRDHDYRPNYYSVLVKLFYPNYVGTD